VIGLARPAYQSLVFCAVTPELLVSANKAEETKIKVMIIAAILALFFSAVFSILLFTNLMVYIAH
jgi:hypothetical protein